MVEFVDITDNLEMAANAYYQMIGHRLYKFGQGSQVNLNDFLSFLFDCSGDELNHKHILLEGDFLYLQPSSWEHYHRETGEAFYSKNKVDYEPSSIADTSRLTQLLVQIEKTLLFQSDYFGLTTQSENILDDEIQQEENQGMLIKNPVFLYDSAIREKFEIPMLIHVDEIDPPEGTYIPYNSRSQKGN